MGIGCSGVFFSVGLTVAARLYFLRTTSDDKMTYIVYNVSRFSMDLMIDDRSDL